MSSDEDHDCSIKVLSKSTNGVLSRGEEINKEIQILTFFHDMSDNLKIMISQDC